MKFSIVTILLFQNIPFLTTKRPVLCNSNILKTRHIMCTDCRFISGQNILEFAILAFLKPFNRCFMTRLQSYQSIYVNKLSIICPSHSNQWKTVKKLLKKQLKYLSIGRSDDVQWNNLYLEWKFQNICLSNRVFVKISNFWKFLKREKP